MIDVEYEEKSSRFNYVIERMIFKRNAILGFADKETDAVKKAKDLARAEEALEMIRILTEFHNYFVDFTRKVNKELIEQANELFAMKNSAVNREKDEKTKKQSKRDRYLDELKAADNRKEYLLANPRAYKAIYGDSWEFFLKTNDRYYHGKN